MKTNEPPRLRTRRASSSVASTSATEQSTWQGRVAGFHACPPHILLNGGCPLRLISNPVPGPGPGQGRPSQPIDVFSLRVRVADLKECKASSVHSMYGPTFNQPVPDGLRVPGQAFVTAQLESLKADSHTLNAIFALAMRVMNKASGKA